MHGSASHLLDPPEAEAGQTALMAAALPQKRPALQRRFANLGSDLGLDPPLDSVWLRSAQRDKRSINLRWLSGSVLTGIGGALLISAAIQVSVQGGADVTVRPDIVRPAVRVHEAQEDRGRKSDRLFQVEPAAGAKQAFRTPVVLRTGDREAIKVKGFVKIAANLSLTTGTYATSIPPFNALKTLSDGNEAEAHQAESAAEVTDADVSIVRKDLGTFSLSGSGLELSDADAAAQIKASHSEDQDKEARSAAPAPSQLLLSRILHQPGALLDDTADAPLAKSPFSALDVRVVPENATDFSKSSETAGVAFSQERSIAFRRGDSLDLILKANGAGPEEIRTIIIALGGRITVNGLGEEHEIRLLMEAVPGAEPTRRIARVFVLRDGVIESGAALNDRNVFVAIDQLQEKIRADRSSVRVDQDDLDGTGPTLYDSLYETAARYGVGSNTVQDLVRIFSYDLDFQHHISPDDRVELFFSENEITSAPGDLLYASLSVGGETRKVYRYVSPEDGIIEYLDENGRSLKKFLLRKPIAEGELRSGFGIRRHPILGYVKMHTGVDWANKIGTPILSAGVGEVIRAEWSSGYGRRVEVQHGNGYVTTYSHMSGFARGIQPGTRVHQGQVVGYLGATGLATGPHLHYEVLVNGHFVDPLKIKVPRSRELEGRLLADFKRQRDQVDDLITKGSVQRVAQRSSIGG